MLWPFCESDSMSWVLSPESSERILALRPVFSAKWRYACAVRAKPFGTITPFDESSRYISPKDAFFPPTTGTSPIPSSLNHITNLLSILNYLRPIFSLIWPPQAPCLEALQHLQRTSFRMWKVPAFSNQFSANNHLWPCHA